MKRLNSLVVFELTFCLVNLTGCLGAAIKPDPQVVSRWTSVLVIPLESPPLETSPDYTSLQQPALVSDTIPPAWNVERGAFVGPGKIPMFGVMTGDTPGLDARIQLGFEQPHATTAIAPRPRLTTEWIPTAVLADQVTTALAKRGLPARLCECVVKLPLTAMQRSKQLVPWYQAIRSWYNRDSENLDKQIDLVTQDVDAVLLVGIGSYSIFEEQTAMKGLFKLFDPRNGRVIGRTASNGFSTHGSSLVLLQSEGLPFKRVILDLSQQLVAKALNALELVRNPAGDALLKLQN